MSVATSVAMPVAMPVVISLALTTLAAPGSLAAQSTAEPTDALFLRAQRLVAEGRGEAGRALVDSQVAAATPGTPPYAEALYWRASLAADAATAERDYQRLIVEYPLSPRVDEALLRLAQLELARGNRERALERLQRLERERPNSQARARASYWMARIYFETDSAPAACARLEDARRRAPAADAELRNQIEYYAQRCLGVDTATTGPGAPSSGVARSTPSAASSATPSARSSAAPGAAPRAAAANRPNASGARAGVAPATSADGAKSASPGYTVQVAAVSSRADAERLARRLATRGYGARVVPLGRLYRVRVGRYATRDAAESAAAGMKAKGITVYVTEAEPR